MIINLPFSSFYNLVRNVGWVKVNSFSPLKEKNSRVWAFWEKKKKNTVIQKSDQENSKAARDAVMPFTRRKRMILASNSIHWLMMSAACQKQGSALWKIKQNKLLFHLGLGCFYGYKLTEYPHLKFHITKRHKWRLAFMRILSCSIFFFCALEIFLKRT